MAKTTELTIALRALDKATGPIKQVHAHLQKMTAPVRTLNQRMAAFTKRASAGFAKLRSALGGIALGLAGIGVAAAAAWGKFKSWIDAGDKLAKTADQVGVSVDSLAQLRFAAGQSGVETEHLDKSLEGLTKRLGEARAGSGSLHSWLKKTNPALLEQVTSAGKTEDAMLLLADAMQNLESPTDRAALANAAFGRSGAPLINLLKNGRKGVKALTDEFARNAGPQEEMARNAELLKDELGRLDTVSLRVKASILTGLAPALLKLGERARNFLLQNSHQISQWVKDFGEKLPGRIERLVGFLGKVKDAMGFVVEHAREIALLFAGLKVASIAGAFASTGAAAGGFAGKLGGATAALGTFAAGLAFAAGKVDEWQSEQIAKSVDRESLRRHTIGQFAGGNAALATMRETGIIGKDNRVNRFRFEELGLSEDARDALRKSRRTGKQTAASRAAEAEVQTAIANAMTAQIRETMAAVKYAMDNRPTALPDKRLDALIARGASLPSAPSGEVLVRVEGPSGTRSEIKKGEGLALEQKTGFQLKPAL